MKSFKTSGAILPSSKYLGEKMLKGIDFEQVNVIVEFGPGNGVITKKVLQRMHKDAFLIVFEINEQFYKELQQIKDPRLILVNRSAETLGEVLKENSFSAIDVVISSLPLSVIPKTISERILQETYTFLNNGGIYVQFQYSTQFYEVIKVIFNNLKLRFEMRNIPPAFIYYCVKEKD